MTGIKSKNTLANADCIADQSAAIFVNNALSATVYLVYRELWSALINVRAGPSIDVPISRTFCVYPIMVNPPTFTLIYGMYRRFAQ